jgi:hypothetical protein
MNVRTRNPLARIASATTSSVETRSPQYISAVRMRYGTTDVATSSSARRTSGVA